MDALGNDIKLILPGNHLFHRAVKIFLPDGLEDKLNKLVISTNNNHSKGDSTEKLIEEKVPDVVLNELIDEKIPENASEECPVEKTPKDVDKSVP